MELTFIGTATVLVRLGPFTFLTDPNFLHAGEHAPLGYGLRSKRLTEPALSIADLPPLDFIVLSHHHGDHFDDRAASELDHTLPIITEPHSAVKLASQGFTNSVGLKKWARHEVTKHDHRVVITAMPGKHAPGALGPLLPKVMGSLIELFNGEELVYRVYITGDTLLHDELHEIPKRFPDIDLCLIHLGGTRIAGVLLTMDAEQGVEALRIVQPKAATPIHYDDYTVFKSPLSDFKELAQKKLPDIDFHYVQRGETVQLPMRNNA